MGVYEGLPAHVRRNNCAIVEGQRVLDGDSIAVRDHAGLSFVLQVLQIHLSWSSETYAARIKGSEAGRGMSEHSICCGYRCTGPYARKR